MSLDLRRLARGPEPEPEIAVIVPVYNSAPFLAECIASVKAQSYTRWQMILVDDGSTDKSPEICAQAASSDPRIRVIHTRNRGVSSARNTALDNLPDDVSHVFFLDSDDTIPENALDTLRCETDLYDIVLGVLVAPKYPYNRYPDLKPAAEILEDILYQQTLQPSVCGKLFHRRLFENLRFKEGSRYEDLLITPYLYLQVEKVCVCPRITYNYRMQPDSFSHTWSENRLDVLSVTETIERDMKTVSENLYRAARNRRFSAACNVLGTITRYKTHPEKRAELQRILRQYRREVLTDTKSRHKNRLGALLSYLPAPIFRHLLARVT